MHEQLGLTEVEIMKVLDTHRENYQQALTKRLDGLKDDVFDQGTINEIVLWKDNRFAQLTDDVLLRLNAMSDLEPKQHAPAPVVELLRLLLLIKGVDLAMASTFLRFRNPEVFQIIDQRAYRKLTGISLPVRPWTSVDIKVATYVDYMNALWLCFEELQPRYPKLSFRDMDRLLYQLDKSDGQKLR